MFLCRCSWSASSFLKAVNSIQSCLKDMSETKCGITKTNLIPLLNNKGYIRRRSERAVLRYYLTLDNDDEVLSIRVLPMHYGIKAMGAMTLRISELYLSFSPHPNISDGNFNLVHHFFRIQIFQINEKGSRWAWIRWRRRRKWK